VLSLGDHYISMAMDAFSSWDSENTPIDVGYKEFAKEFVQTFPEEDKYLEDHFAEFLAEVLELADLLR